MSLLLKVQCEGQGSVTPLGALGTSHFKKKFGLDGGLRGVDQADVWGEGLQAVRGRGERTEACGCSVCGTCSVLPKRGKVNEGSEEDES